MVYLKGLPALILQFGHLLSNPSRNVRDGYMDDVLQEDGKVLQMERGRQTRNVLGERVGVKSGKYYMK